MRNLIFGVIIIPIILMLLGNGEEKQQSTNTIPVNQVQEATPQALPTKVTEPTIYEELELTLYEMILADMGIPYNLLDESRCYTKGYPWGNGIIHCREDSALMYKEEGLVQWMLFPRPDGTWTQQWINYPTSTNTESRDYYVPDGSRHSRVENFLKLHLEGAQSISRKFADKGYIWPASSILAQVGLESGWGRSILARSTGYPKSTGGYNFFCIKQKSNSSGYHKYLVSNDLVYPDNPQRWHDDCCRGGKSPRKGCKEPDGEPFYRFKSINAAYEAYTYLITRSKRYKHLGTSEWREKYPQYDPHQLWAWGLKANGYATSERYGEKILKVIEDHRLKEFDVHEENS